MTAAWPQAIILDVDGTLAETEEWHRQAFNRAFAAHGLDWHWDRDCYRDLLKVTGGKERIRHFAAGRADAIDVDAIHALKNRLYQQHVAGGPVELRPGVADLVGHARRSGIRLGIATTTSRGNLASLLHSAFGPGSQGWFDVIVAGEDVAAKKPDPEAYEVALAGLALPPEACLAVEDSRNGLEAASAAGIACLVTPSEYCGDDDVSGAWCVVANLAARAPGDLLARR